MKPFYAFASEKSLKIFCLEGGCELNCSSQINRSSWGGQSWLRFQLIKNKFDINKWWKQLGTI